jgi:hypothetical protein
MVKKKNKSEKKEVKATKKVVSKAIKNNSKRKTRTTISKMPTKKIVGLKMDPIKDSVVVRKKTALENSAKKAMKEEWEYGGSYVKDSFKHKAKSILKRQVKYMGESGYEKTSKGYSPKRFTPSKVTGLKTETVGSTKKKK